MRRKRAEWRGTSRGTPRARSRRMPTTDLVSGPNVSRRFGRALRVNVLGGPATVCTFHCGYCRSPQPTLRPDTPWPAASAILDQASLALRADFAIDSIVIGSNGEPTLHPAFAAIMDGMIALRDAVVPGASIAVVSNGSTLGRLEVRHA